MLLGLALLNRASFAIITFGMKVPSGLVLPSMSIGALFGRLVGTYMEYLTRAYSGAEIFAKCPADSRCVIPGIYALVGAGATLTGATHTTIAVVAILMELTGNLIYTLPVLVGVMTARWVAEYFCPSGIYDLLLEHAGHPYFDNKTQYIHTRRTAAELMQTDLETICVDYENENTLALLSARLKRISARGLADGGFPIVNSRGHLLGWIACAELEFAISRCRDLDPETVCFFNNPLWQADYIAHDPTAIPHFRTPLDYVKAKNRDSRNGATASTEGSGADSSEEPATSPFAKIQNQWNTIFASLADTRAADVPDMRPLLSSESDTRQLPSYLSNNHPTLSSSSGPVNVVKAPTPLLDDTREIRHAHITSIPFFQDRPNDFTPFVDQTPLTISTNSPIELVANLLSRLGISYLCIVDKGVYCGAIFKKAYIGYVKELEEAGYTR
ncbi:hypothetical protein LPJ73_005196 [Coemansia sp. RSA 2703]|nr:hypothetical protein LPJ73_005196 [Coemansia sp. RSA 2703]